MSDYRPGDEKKPWVRAQWDRRQTCSCGHAYRDHATGGTHCLAASNDPDQRTGQMCQCSLWRPLEPRLRRSCR